MTKIKSEHIKKFNKEGYVLFKNLINKKNINDIKKLLTNLSKKQKLS